MALQKMSPPLVWVMKREIFWLPFFGWAIAAMEPIAIDRASGRKAITQIVEQGKKTLDSGKWVVIFPEGTRVPPGKKGRYGLGAAILATQSGYPVIPVALNSGEFWRRNDFIKRPGTIDVVIGKPIESKGKDPSELNQQAEEWRSLGQLGVPLDVKRSRMAAAREGAETVRAVFWKDGNFNSFGVGFSATWN